MTFLKKYPVDDPRDKAWLLHTEASIVEAVEAEKKEREELEMEEPEKSASAKWTDMHPWLRLCMCMCDDRARAALQSRDMAWDRSTLDARNSEDRPPNWCEVVADLYNDPSIVFATEALPFLHANFQEQFDLRFEDMPGGAIDAEDVKKRHADSRSSLISVSNNEEPFHGLIPRPSCLFLLSKFVCSSCIQHQQVIYDWERSGDGFGQRNIKKDSSWGHFADEHLESTDGDNRTSFLPRKHRNTEHLLYFWHLSDTENILCTMLNVLSKDVSVDCDGKVKIDTQSVQHKRKKTVDAEMEAKEKRVWRGNLSSSMKAMAITQAEDNLRKTENEAAEHEVKELEAATTPVRNVYKRRKEELQKRAGELLVDLTEMRESLRIKRNKGDTSSNNSTADTDTTS